MPDSPTLEDLQDSVVVLEDKAGRRARFIVDRILNHRVYCSYVFRGQHPAPLQVMVGDQVEFGTSGDGCWIRATGRVEAAVDRDAIVVDVRDLAPLQRRSSFREQVALNVLVREHFTDIGRRGHTENLSIGGFAARLHNRPVPDGTQALASIEMPEGDEVTVTCRKIAGDIHQRFQFLDLDRRTEDRFARIVRSAELSHRRARHHRR